MAAPPRTLVLGRLPDADPVDPRGEAVRIDLSMATVHHEEHLLKNVIDLGIGDPEATQDAVGLAGVGVEHAAKLGDSQAATEASRQRREHEHAGIMAGGHRIFERKRGASDFG